MARVPYRRREDVHGKDRAIFDRLEAERRVPTPKIFLALAHAPEQLDGLLTYSKSLRTAKELGSKLRELLIIAIAHARGGPYIAEAHERDALQAGYTAEQVSAIPAGRDRPDMFNDVERAVITLGQAIGGGHEVTSDLWDAAASHLTHRQMVQLVLTAAWYSAGIITTSVLGLDLDDDPPPESSEDQR